MKRSTLHLLLLIALTGTTNVISAQKNDFEKLSQSPKDTSITFPLDYKIARPRLEYPHWDDDYDVYYHFLTPAVRKTQAALSYTRDGIVTNITPNSIMPHAQLDTATIFEDPQKLLGTWRMITFRSIRFNDSVDIPSKKYYRMADTLLEDKSNEEAFAIFSDNEFRLHAKETEKKTFKKMISAKYKIENKRFMMVYKLVKAGAGVSQFGVDENGYLVINYPRVIEVIKKGEYFSYYTVLDQYILMKVKTE